MKPRNTSPGIMACLLFCVSMTSPCIIKAQFSSSADVFCTGCAFPKFIHWDGQPGADLLSESADTLYISLNDGSGQFLAPFAIGAKPAGAELLAADDVDDDGDMDFLVGSPEGLWLLRNNAGTLVEILLDQDNYTGPGNVFSNAYLPMDTLIFQDPRLFSSYFDEDDLKDIQFRRMSGNSFTWFRNDGLGGYVKQVIPLWGNDLFDELVAFDWDGDGFNDLIIPGLRMSPQIDGSWGYPWADVASDASWSGVQLSVVDVNLDGLPDLIAGQAVFLRTSDGQLEQICCMSSSGGIFSWVGNLDCDPEPEIFRWNPTAGHVSQWVVDLPGNTVENRFVALPYATPEDEGLIFTMHLALADVDGDGRVDAIYQAVYAWLVPTDVVLVARNITGGFNVSLDLPFNELPPDTVVPLSGGLPEGGLYTGDGVFGNALHTSLAGPGPLEITYTYVDEFNCGGSVTAVIDIATGIQGSSRTGSRMLTAYPNPTRGTLFVAPGATGVDRVRLLDLLGRQVTPWTTLPASGLGSLELHGLAPGQYVLEAEGRAGERSSLRIQRVH